MSKDKMIAIRISVADYDMIKKMDGNFTEIFKIGMEKWAVQYPEFLQSEAQRFKEMYVHCIALQGGVYKSSIQRTTHLDELYKLYIAQGRNVNTPNHEDKYWVNQRLQKLENGNKISVAEFFEYAQKKFKDEKQKRLEVNE